MLVELSIFVGLFFGSIYVVWHWEWLCSIQHKYGCDIYSFVIFLHMVFSGNDDLTKQWWEEEEDSGNDDHILSATLCDIDDGEW